MTQDFVPSTVGCLLSGYFCDVAQRGDSQDPNSAGARTWDGMAEDYEANPKLRFFQRRHWTPSTADYLLSELRHSIC